MVEAEGQLYDWPENEPKVGTRVRVATKGYAGTVRYHGKIEGKGEEIWLGVELDEEKGKNEGSVGDISYFSCPRMHGLFSKVCSFVPENLVREKKKKKSKIRSSTGSFAPELTADKDEFTDSTLNMMMALVEQTLGTVNGLHQQMISQERKLIQKLHGDVSAILKAQEVHLVHRIHDEVSSQLAQHPGYNRMRSPRQNSEDNDDHIFCSEDSARSLPSSGLSSSQDHSTSRGSDRDEDIEGATTRFIGAPSITVTATDGHLVPVSIANSGLTRDSMFSVASSMASTPSAQHEIPDLPETSDALYQSARSDISSAGTATAITDGDRYHAEQMSLVHSHLTRESIVSFASSMASSPSVQHAISELPKANIAVSDARRQSRDHFQHSQTSSMRPHSAQEMMVSSSSSVISTLPSERHITAEGMARSDVSPPCVSSMGITQTLTDGTGDLINAYQTRAKAEEQGQVNTSAMPKSPARFGPSQDESSMLLERQTSAASWISAHESERSIDAACSGVSAVASREDSSIDDRSEGTEPFQVQMRRSYALRNKSTFGRDSRRLSASRMPHIPEDG